MRLDESSYVAVERVPYVIINFEGISEPLALQDNKSKRGLGHERANMPSFQALARPFLGKFIGSHLSELKFGSNPF